jgi:uncharacterized membrane protein
MAAFLGDIAFLLGIIVASAGLFTLHRAAGDPKPALLKTAGIVLLVAGIATALCTAYYYARYHFAGDLDHAYPAHLMAPPPMHGGGHGMMRMMKMRGGMGERRGPGAAMVLEPGEDEAPADSDEKEHEAHHPDQ